MAMAAWARAYSTSSSTNSGMRRFCSTRGCDSIESAYFLHAMASKPASPRETAGQRRKKKKKPHVLSMLAGEALLRGSLSLPSLLPDLSTSMTSG